MTVQRPSVIRPRSRGARVTGAPEPVPYDFRRPLTMARDHARHLEMAFERFGRQWATQLTARLRAPVEVSLDDLALRPYEEYVSTLPSPTVLLVCSVGEPRTTGLLQLPLPLTLVWVDYLFGGAGRGDDRERELTEIEVTLLRDLLGHAFSDMRYAFASVLELDVVVTGVQYNPQFVRVAGAADPVVVATFTIRLGERSDTVTFMLPAGLLLEALRGSDHDVRTPDLSADAAVQAELDAAVGSVPVEVTVRIAPTRVVPREVVDLQVGDVLPLHHPRTRPLEVVVGDVVLAHAALGTRGSRLACQVVTVEEARP